MLAAEPDVVRLGLQCLIFLLFTSQGRLAGQQWAESADNVVDGKNGDNLLKLLVSVGSNSMLAMSTKVLVVLVYCCHLQTQLFPAAVVA